MEIRPIPSRLRQLLRKPADDTDSNSDDIIMVGAHILHFVDPFPHLKAHQAACEGTVKDNHNLNTKSLI